MKTLWNYFSFAFRWYEMLILLIFFNQKFNQVVIWDKIILRGDNALLNYHGMNTKYYFFDDGLGLKWVYQTTLLWMPYQSQTSEMCMDIDFSFLVSFSFFSGETRMSVCTYPGM